MSRQIFKFENYISISIDVHFCHHQMIMKLSPNDALNTIKMRAFVPISALKNAKLHLQGRQKRHSNKFAERWEFCI